MTERYYYESVHVDGTANSETIETILTSTEEEHKFVDAIQFIEDGATHTRTAVVEVYIEREKILNVPYEVVLTYSGDNARDGELCWFLLGHDLPVGQSLRVGHVSGSTASDIYYTVRYQIKE